jgi:hypothetical protein
MGGEAPRTVSSFHERAAIHMTGNHDTPQKNYTVHALVMLGFTLVLGAFAFALVIHHRDLPQRVQTVHEARSATAQP